MMELKKRRDIGDIIQDSLNFALKEARPLWRIVFTFITPLYMLLGVLSGFFQYRIQELGFQEKMNEMLQEKDMEGLQTLMLDYFSQIYGNWQFGVIVVANLLLSSFLAACVYIYMKKYATESIENVQEGEIRNEAIGQVFRLLAYNLLGSLLLMLGFMLFFLPGVYLCVPISFLLVTAIAENGNFRATLSRCFSLTSGNWWMSAVSIIIVAFMALFATGLAQGLFSAIVLSLKSLIGDKMTIVLSSSVSTGLTSLYSTVVYMSVAIIYYTLAFETPTMDERIEDIGNNEA